jgi:hypothetical protein
VGVIVLRNNSSCHLFKQLKKDGSEAVQDAEKEMHNKLQYVFDPVGLDFVGSYSVAKDDPSGRNRRMTKRFGLSSADPKAIADRITFGTVRVVSGRTITMVVLPTRAR